MLLLKTLGGLSVEADGARASGAAQQRKTLALLALLAASRRGMSRDKLIAYLWPEADAEHARNTLKQACHALRRDLHPELFLGAVELRLNPDVLTSDIGSLEDALDRGDPARAVAAYSGPFLDGFYLAGAVEFERWVEETRAALKRRVGEALECLATHAASVGDVHGAVHWWRRLATLDPLNSHVALGLMNTLAAAGDRAGALQVARAHEARLRDELDAAPDPAVVELTERLRAQSEPPPGNGAVPVRVASEDIARIAQESADALERPARPRTAANVRAYPGEADLRGGDRMGRQRGRRLAAVWIALLALLAAGGVFTKIARVWWARYGALPDIQRHVAAGNWETAHRLAARVEKIIPNDPGVAAVRATFADTIRIEGTPVGARVYRRPYAADSNDWEFLGFSPIERVLLPRVPVLSQFKFEAPAFETAFDIGAAAPATATTFSPVLWPVRFSLAREGSVPDGMVLVLGEDATLGMPQVDRTESAQIPDFYLDRLEVTNREYQVFVDSGGYQRRALWVQDFVEDGRALTWKEAVGRFVDQTGRPGPSTWEAGRYPRDRAEHPVGGVSWYEAAAYARFRGKHLPSLFQWSRAARFSAAGAIIAASNIDHVRDGTAPVGSFRGMSGSGALDMAGNVREWCFNESKSRRGRYILGGGWNDGAYTFYHAAIHSPFDRSSTNGIRLALPAHETRSDGAANRPIEPLFRDYHTERPVSDQAFQFYRRLFAYDPAPLDVRVERRDSTAQWIREKVSFNAAYGGERVTVYIFLPLNTRPPYQTVVFFPGTAVLRARSSDSLQSVGMFDYLVEGGRAVVYPVYKGTYERDDGTRFSDPDESNWYRDHVIQWQKDVSRTLDYVGTRVDVDSTKLAFLGFSWGGRFGGVVLAIERRFKAAVLTVAGLHFRRALPEVDDLNYVSRVHLPVLMLNGRYDNNFPLETSARPMFDLLGTPAGRKRLVVVDGVHYVPRHRLIRETLDWFDRYLGPVR